MTLLLLAEGWCEVPLSTIRRGIELLLAYPAPQLQDKTYRQRSMRTEGVRDPSCWTPRAGTRALPQGPGYPSAGTTGRESPRHPRCPGVACLP